MIQPAQSIRTTDVVAALQDVIMAAREEGMDEMAGDLAELLSLVQARLIKRDLAAGAQMPLRRTAARHV